jgi:hypothetical protein
MNITKTCKMAPRLAVLVAFLMATPALAQGSSCASISVDGIRASIDFTDGFETGDIAPWLAPVHSAISASATLDLIARVELPPEVTGSHLLELRFILPGGELYQSLSFPIASSGLIKAAALPVPGYPFPVAVHAPVAAASKVPGGWQVEQNLPVAGTPILDTSLFGTWSLAAFLDQSENPCTVPLSFDLQP